MVIAEQHILQPDNLMINKLSRELRRELEEILSYWMIHTPDQENGGFYGRIGNDNRADKKADKGLVLNARILWSFSAAYDFTGKPEYRKMADRSFYYILDHFRDPAFGGLYWSLDYRGKMKDGKKQIYGLAFCIYAMAVYFQATGDLQALHLAKDLFEYIEQYSYDKERGGYFEAFTRGWQVMDDLRLSEKDENEKKTMNTHLHIIEAYAALYKVWKDKRLKNRIQELLQVFQEHIIDKESGHLHLFMDEDWKVKSSLVSYGHDIEAAWLLPECASVISDREWIDNCRALTVKLTDAACEGLDLDGGLWYEYNTAADELVREKHSWPQAEAMVAFIHAWLLTGHDRYLLHAFGSWNFIKKYIKDRENGEWFWGIHADHSVMEGEDKAGFWKCPYHNTRACMEVLKRIGPAAA